ncbi:hypothetical protein PoB_004016800 [Plakobranchus ocellatus]|uniref:Uncharacterized protein n=1 Tax=Plakobranchus ocellatus TaxID=259542 RepID=A0AAV4B4F9_9GAST|nr:hypothetical protein PoB_004016800 [Plakobranchus ocellatus]
MITQRLWLSGPPPGQGAGDGARTRNRRVPADLRVDSLSAVPLTAPIGHKKSPMRYQSSAASATVLG